MTFLSYFTDFYLSNVYLLLNDKLWVIGKLSAIGKLLVVGKILVHTNLFSVGKHLVNTVHFAL